MVEEVKKMTPMLEQWHKCKKDSNGALLLFQMGDFFECFYEDAEILSRELELTLTERQGVPMSGVPCHTCDIYVDRLVGKGFVVAVAKQMENAGDSKGLVARKVVDIMSPGVRNSGSVLDAVVNNFFACIVNKKGSFGLSYVDLTTGEFVVFESEDVRHLCDEIFRVGPAEILVSKSFRKFFKKILGELKLSLNFSIAEEEDWFFSENLSKKFLEKHLGVNSLSGFGLRDISVGTVAAGSLLKYLQEVRVAYIDHITSISLSLMADRMYLDSNCQRNLELTESLHGDSKSTTLLGILDNTSTPMGGRLIRKFLKAPSINLGDIKDRQDGVKEFLNNESMHSELLRLLSNVRDIERLIIKVANGNAGPRDLVSLAMSLKNVGVAKNFCNVLSSSLLNSSVENMDGADEVVIKVLQTIEQDSPQNLGSSPTIRSKVNGELDNLRTLLSDGMEWIKRYQEKIRNSTGIKNLKVGFNKIFGYYIEISRGQSHLAPSSFVKKQTLTNSERFISEELKDYENKIVSAESKVLEIERKIFSSLVEWVSGFKEVVCKISDAVAIFDVLLSFAIAAKRKNFCCPAMNGGFGIEVRGGRHPVVESAFDDHFVPNDVVIDSEKDQVILITGPNMGGKSTYIRQVAIIVIMAQMGSFVPAEFASIGIVDRIFTRIGANDDLARGQSTFMVEMADTANILNNATKRSLVILDEIGRGTGTYDGISIAWAVIEYFLLNATKQAKILFATHYLELTKLEEKYDRVVNYSVIVDDSREEVVFLHKIYKGKASKSYGIHVASIAGFPENVVNRASEILRTLESNSGDSFCKSAKKKREKSKNDSERQLSLLSMQDAG